MERRVEKSSNGLNKSIARVLPRNQRRQTRILEFFHKFTVDSDPDIPAYYVVNHNGHRVEIRIGVSFELKRNGNIKETSRGRLFYPIVIKKENTGNCFSINAPFMLNTLRSNLQPENTLNTSLIERAAIFAAALFRKALIPKFGASAYLLLKESSSTVEPFLQKLHGAMLSEKCILNNKYSKKSKTLSDAVFCGKDRYLPCRILERNAVKHYQTADDLYGFIGNDHCITREVRDPDIRALLVSKLGAQPFTIHDVVLLKISDYKKISQFKGWHFTSKDAFTSEMLREKVQARYANAIYNHLKELSKEEKNQLKLSYSWLSASGVLRPLSGKDGLFVWSGKIPEFPGFDKGDLIHDCIANHPLMKKLHAAPYDVNKSLRDATLPKLERGELNEAEKARLLDFLLNNASKLNSQIIKMLKSHTIFPDARGRLVEFRRLIMASKNEVQVFGDAINFPAQKLLKSRIFLQRFHIRRKINEDDILRKAEQIRQTQDKDDTFSFEGYLNKRRMSLKLTNRLKTDLVILCTNGTLQNPNAQRIYYDTKMLRSVVGDDVLYAKGDFRTLFRQLGVEFQPSTGDILKFIAELRDAKSAPPNRYSLYTGLSKALSKEDSDPRKFQDDEIIYVKGGYFRPKEVLLNVTFRRYLLGSKVYTNAKGHLFKSLIALGCKLEPISSDYVDFLKWVSTRMNKPAHLKFRDRYVSLIYLAYSKLSSPNGIGLDDPIILTHDDQMVSRSEVAEQRIFIDDDPQLSRQIKTAKSPILFVNCGSQGYDFMQALGVPKLSASVVLVERDVKAPQPPNEEAETLLSKLKSTEVINAISSMVQQNDEWRADIQDLDWAAVVENLRTDFAESIHKTFSIGSYRFSTDAESCVLENAVYFLSSLKLTEMRDRLAIETSQIILKTKHNQSSLGDSIYRILEGDIFHYLNSKGYVYEERIKPSEQTSVPEIPPEITPSSKPEVIEVKPEKETIQEPGESIEDEEEQEIQVEVMHPEDVETPPASGWRGRGPGPAARFRTADIANYWILRMENEDAPEGLAIDRSDEDLGFDIEVRKHDTAVKMIEIKSSSERVFPNKIEMTPNEWRKAKSEQNRYWLYVVRDVLKDSREMRVEEIRNRVRKFANPYGAFKDTATFQRKMVTKSEKRVIINLNLGSSGFQSEAQ